MFASGDETGDVCHVGYEESADTIPYFGELLEVGDAGVGGVADEEDFGLVLFGEFGDLVVV